MIRPSRAPSSLVRPPRIWPWSRRGSTSATGWSPTGNTSSSVGCRSPFPLRQRRFPGEIREHIRAVHSAAGRDVLGNGGTGLHRHCRISVPAGGAAAAGRFPNHSGVGDRPGGERRHHGHLGRGTARAAIRPDPGRHPADLAQHARGSDNRHSVRTQPQHRLGGAGRAGGDHGREQDLAAVHDDAAELQEGEPGRFADPAALGAFRYLAASGVTLEDIRGTLATATANAAKGTVNTDKISFTIAANDQILQAGPFNDVILAYRNGGPIRVSDVGQAVAEPVDRTVAGYQNNKSGIILAVFKQPGANVVETVDQIKAQLPHLTARIPPAVQVETILDRTTTIRASVRDVQFTLALTIALVVLVVFLFLRNFWATFIPSITVPLALLGSCAAMYMFNFSLDNLSLMALTIAVGFVV